MTVRLLAAGAPASAPTGPKVRARIPSTQLIAIGASTGGTEAICEILRGLPARTPGIVITQHMPPGFTASFAARLDASSALRVAEAQDRQPVLDGHAYVAPGGRHLFVERGVGGGWALRVVDGPLVNRHKPSVDVLFRSVARVAGPRAIGLMLTGMGGDGALAMREMRDHGAYNLVQDEASCVVFGMPKEAIAAGAAHEVLPLQRMAGRLLARMAGPAAA